jgi:hypothetical protein
MYNPRPTGQHTLSIVQIPKFLQRILELVEVKLKTSIFSRFSPARFHPHFSTVAIGQHA